MNSKLLVVAAVSLLILTGCAVDPTATVNADEANSAPAMDAGPVELTKEEAGERYLQLVCQGNANLGVLEEAANAGMAEFVAGGAPSPDALRAGGTEAVRLKRMFVEVIDDTYYEWPDAVAEQLPHLRSNALAEIAADQQLMNATTFEEAYYVTYPAPSPEQAAAAQEIRYQLELNADTTASCVGHETGLDEIHAEMVERNEQLAALVKQ